VIERTYETRRGGRAALVVAIAALPWLGGCGDEARPVPAAAASTAPAAGQPVQPSADPVRVPMPITVRVPRLGIAAGLEPVTLDRAGRLRPPAYGRAGWYRAGPEPGEPGRAVIAGHVDSKSGPDVFYRLSAALPGDRVLIDHEAGVRTQFAVRRVERHPQTAFPSERVYGGSGRPELRLITCGGDYDRSRGGYQDNVIVFADRVR